MCHSLCLIYSNTDVNKHITSVQKDRKCLPSVVCEEGIVIINPGPPFSLVEAKRHGCLEQKNTGSSVLWGCFSSTVQERPEVDAAVLVRTPLPESKEMSS